MTAIDLRCGRAEDVQLTLADNSVDLIVTDLPYFKIKGDWWDHQWDNPSGFLEWIGQLCEQWQRILKPNGSLYVFASPEMSDRVSVIIRQWFNVLTRVRWVKEEGWHKKAEKEALRSYLSPWEEIIFAEHYGADGYAKGEAGYAAKCDELRGFVFEPIRAYLKNEVLRAGLTTRKVAEAFQEKTGSRTVTGMAGHWLEQVQWCLPTAENYTWLCDLVNTQGHHPAPPYSDYHEAPRSRFEPGKNGDGPEDLRADYEYLRADYEYLRADYEYLRRPFFADKERPYTDVWTFPTVPGGNGKHPCEKPVALMEHIILTSSRPGATVLDCCMGRGSTAVACVNTGRSFIGCDVEDKWVRATERRLAQHKAQAPLPTMAEEMDRQPVRPKLQLSLEGMTG